MNVTVRGYGTENTRYEVEHWNNSPDLIGCVVHGPNISDIRNAAQLAKTIVDGLVAYKIVNTQPPMKRRRYPNVQEQVSEVVLARIGDSELVDVAEPNGQQSEQEHRPSEESVQEATADAT